MSKANFKKRVSERERTSWTFRIISKPSVARVGHYTVISEKIYYRDITDYGRKTR